MRVDVSGMVAEGPGAPFRVGEPFAAAFVPSEAGRVHALLTGRWVSSAQDVLWAVDGRAWLVVDGTADGSGTVGLTLLDRTAAEAAKAAEVAHARALAAATFAERVAREASDPMSVLLGRVELLAITHPDATRLDVALEAARRLSATIRHLRDLAQGQHHRLAPVPVERVVEESVDLAGQRLAPAHVEIRPADLEIATELSTAARAIAAALRGVGDPRRPGTTELSASRDRDGVALVVRGPPRARVDLPSGPADLAALGAAWTTSWDGLSPAIRLSWPGVPRARTPDARPARLRVVGDEGFAEAVAATLAHDGWEVVRAGPSDAIVGDLGMRETVGELALGAQDGTPIVACGVGVAPPLPEGWAWVGLPLRRTTLLGALGSRPRERR